MTRRYTSEIGIIIGPQQDIPAPDVNTNAADHGVDDGHLLDEHRRHRHRRRHRQADPPGRLARSRQGHRARRVRHRPRGRAAHRTWNSTGARVAVQGFGNVGSSAAELFAQAGAQDRRGAGPHRHHRQRRRLRHGRPDGRMCVRPAASAASRAPSAWTTKPFWDVRCDILIPAALEGQITADARAPHQGQAGARRRQRPDACRRPTTSWPTAASSSCPT